MAITSPPTTDPPRRFVWVFILLFALPGVLALPLPLLLLAGATGGLGEMTRCFQEGGFIMYALLPMHLLLMLMVGGLGGCFIAGRRIPAIALLLPVALPLLLGGGGTLLGLYQLVAALDGADQIIRWKMFAQGLSEVMHPTVLAALSSGVLALGVASAACLGLLALDLPSLPRPPKDPTRTLAYLIMIPFCLLALAGSGLFHWYQWLHTAPPEIVELLFAALLGGSCVATMFLIGSLRRLAILEDRATAGLLWRRAALLPVAAVVALALLGYAMVQLSRMQALGNLAGADLYVVYQVLIKGFSRAAKFYKLTIFDASLAGLVLGLPLVLAGRAATAGLARMRSSFALSLLLHLTVIGGLLLLGTHTVRLLRQTVAITERLVNVPDLELPQVGRTEFDLGPGIALLLTRSGKLLIDDSQGVRPPVPFAAELLERAERHAERDAPGAERAHEEPPAPDWLLRKMKEERERTATAKDGSPPPQTSDEAAGATHKPRPALLLAADRQGTFAELVRWLAPVTGPHGRAYTIVLRHTTPNPELDALLGDFAPLLRASLSGLTFQLVPTVSSAASSPRPGAENPGTVQRSCWAFAEERAMQLLLPDGTSSRLELPANEDYRARAEVAKQVRRQLGQLPDLQRLVYAPRPEDDVATVALALAIWQDSMDLQAIQIVLTPDRVGLEQAAAQAAALIAADSLPQDPARRGPGVNTRSNRAGKVLVLPGRAVLVGSLDREVIRRIIGKHRDQLRFCYEQQLASNPQLSGKVVVTFTIAPTGRITTANVQESTLQHTAVEQCIVTQVRQWVFPQPQGGGIVQVTYPFIFKAL